MSQIVKSYTKGKSSHDLTNDPKLSSEAVHIDEEPLRKKSKVKDDDVDALEHSDEAEPMNLIKG